MPERLRLGTRSYYFWSSVRAAMDGIQKHLKIRIILIHITDARCGGLYSHARLQILSAVSTVPAEGRGDEIVNFSHPEIIRPLISDQPDSAELLAGFVYLWFRRRGGRHPHRGGEKFVGKHAYSPNG